MIYSLDWGIDKDTISIYTLENGKFIKSNKYYIIMKESYDLMEDSRNRGYHSCYDSVDHGASRWFYDLQ